jgi:hypothetical protein
MISHSLIGKFALGKISSIFTISFSHPKVSYYPPASHYFHSELSFVTFKQEPIYPKVQLLSHPCGGFVHIHHFFVNFSEGLSVLPVPVAEIKHFATLPACEWYYL